MKPEKPAGRPWWKYGYVWLVIAGPAVVVVASLVSAWIAMRSPDPVLTEDRREVESNQTLAKNRAQTPAMQGRNHAATPDTAH
jgi:hypothetical protein